MELNQFDFVEYIRKPFSVQAVRVTRENLDDLAPFVGKVERTPEGKPYIQADRHLCQSSLKVWPGYFVTKHGKKVRVFSRKAFEEQFHPMGDDVAPWVEYLNGAPPEPKAKQEEVQAVEVVDEPAPDSEPETVEEVEEVDMHEGDPEGVSEGEVKRCSHGTPEGVECAYRPCDGPA